MGPGVLSEDSWYGSSFKSASGSSPNWDASVNLLMIKMAKSRERLRKLPTKTSRRKEKICPSRREIRRKESPKRSKVCTTNALHKDHSLLFGSYTIHTYCTTYVSPVNKKNVNKREA